MTSIAELRTELSTACTTFDAFANESSETGTTLNELQARTNAIEKAFRPVQTSWKAVTLTADWDNDRTMKGKYEASLSRFNDLKREVRNGIRKYYQSRSAQASGGESAS